MRSLARQLSALRRLGAGMVLLALAGIGSAVALPARSATASVNAAVTTFVEVASQRAPHIGRVSAGPSELTAGSLAPPRPEQERGHSWQVAAVQVTGLAIAVLGGVLLLPSARPGRHNHPRILGWLLLGWALLSTRRWVRLTPPSSAIVDFAAACGQSVLAALAVVFLLRYARWRYPPLEKGLLLQCLLLPMTLLLGGPNRLQWMSSLWSLLLGIEVVLGMGLFLVLTWPDRRRDFWAMAPSFAAVASLLMLELAYQHRVFAMPSAHIGQLGLSVALIAIALRVLTQLSSAAATLPPPPKPAADEAQRLRARLSELSARHESALGELQSLRLEVNQLRERKRPALPSQAFNAEAERQLAHMAELRVEQVTAQERKRIAADLHDDLGAKLLTIVHTSDSDHISTLAREALEEMRLSVRGLSGKPMRLADALADWRAETVARLSQANIEIDWRGIAEDTEQRLAARSFVQTTRILREAISNIIKHSGASQCKVRCGIREQEFGLIVQDNGNGISVDMEGKLDRGHGMASMKNRAKQMQGQCLVESGPGYGTVIRLTLPL